MTRPRLIKTDKLSKRSNGFTYRVKEKEPFTGSCIVMTEDLIPVKEENYLCGLKEGFEVIFRKGALESKHLYKRGELDGFSEYYAESGHLRRLSLYKKGKLKDHCGTENFIFQMLSSPGSCNSLPNYLKSWKKNGFIRERDRLRHEMYTQMREKVGKNRIRWRINYLKNNSGISELKLNLSLLKPYEVKVKKPLSANLNSNIKTQARYSLIMRVDANGVESGLFLRGKKKIAEIKTVNTKGILLREFIFDDIRQEGLFKTMFEFFKKDQPMIIKDMTNNGTLLTSF